MPFTQENRESLRAWLAEAGWPRNHMDFATVEGYLVALLVWPVGLPSGAWLPAIWGERGWKVPAKIASLDAYFKFIALVEGFLHELDHNIGKPAQRFAPTLSTIAGASRNLAPPGVPWAQGFLKGLQQNSQGLNGRSIAARAAVTRIAECASLPVTWTIDTAEIAADIRAAVLALAGERATRGPLGALLSAPPVRPAPRPAHS